MTNTTGDILFDLNDQDYYVSLTGRWFRAKSLEGPWTFVDGDRLPKDFAKIPESRSEVQRPRDGSAALLPRRRP